MVDSGEVSGMGIAALAGTRHEIGARTVAVA
jgi:hypothetical protein